jgi:DNA polymerase elongation subunit (family B)
MIERLAVLDCEVYKNYFLIALKNLHTGKTVLLDVFGEKCSLSESDIKKLKAILTSGTTFGFNSKNYDIPVILQALKGKTCLEIYELSKFIVETGSKSWQTLKRYNLKELSRMKHFDIQEPAPAVMISLKLYGGRLHSKKLQDLPIDPHATLTKDQTEILRKYCVNDLDTTIDLYKAIESRIQLRKDMSKEYGVDLLSKSDAQIAEAVIKTELYKKGITRKLYAPELDENETVRYEVPDFITFKHPRLKELLELIRSTRFELTASGSVKLPETLSKFKLEIGSTKYKIGIGGLHSQEKKQIVKSDNAYMLIDKDVTSYYPSIILNQGLYPKQMTKKFLDVYRSIVERRVQAKRDGNKVVNESLKIVINGSFGKFGSKYSALYSPQLLLQTTITGQLSLLMCIETLEAQSFKVVSANTDGFVTLVERTRQELYEEICTDWECHTGFNLEANEYKALYSRDVNNYLAHCSNDDLKGKGIFAKESLMKSPQAKITVDAVVQYLVHGTSIEETIKACQDVTKFLSVRTVKGGGVWKGDYLGKVVRWIYSVEGEPIFYKSNGNKVAKTDGCRPMLDLEESFPVDIDYDRYIEESNKILKDLGL